MKPAPLIVTIVVIILIIIGVVAYSTKNNVPPNTAGSNGDTVYCTLDAKICPDGSSVGRIPPKCEFAACPVSTNTPSAVVVSGGIGTMLLGSDTQLTPLSVVEDSRCGTDVVCIQAGTVRVSTRVHSEKGTSTETFTLNTPISYGKTSVILTAVAPAPRSTVKIATSSYLFTYSIYKAQ